ncbi:hypothetical protein [Rhizobium sp. Rhizsp42]|uniref:hypothetical protein n=1 Tax=Rhizobium sp. Rhizsp42 TaxID=3243034 RepID=UPI0039AF0AFB
MMSENQIPEFVQEVADTGCDITAVLGSGYLIGDADLSLEAYEIAAPRLRKIGEKHGSRDHLVSEIFEYLVSIGRYYPKRQRIAAANDT